MYEWMNGWMNEWMNELINEWMTEWTSYTVMITCYIYDLLMFMFHLSCVKCELNRML